MNPIADPESRSAADRARELTDQRILSMRPVGQPGESIDAVLRRRIEALAQGLVALRAPLHQR
jgi:hypothetical protein